MPPRKNPVIYIGACEYEVIFAKTKKESEKYLGPAIDKGGIRWWTRGKAFLDHKRIVVHHDLRSKQDELEVFVHEALHALCHENAENEALCNVDGNEAAVAILSKGVISFMRQYRDLVKGGGV